MVESHCAAAAPQEKLPSLLSWKKSYEMPVPEHCLASHGSKLTGWPLSFGTVQQLA